MIKINIKGETMMEEIYCEGKIQKKENVIIYAYIEKHTCKE